jgi:RNA polymerase sigma-70 factor (ECF subfamily)
MDGPETPKDARSDIDALVRRARNDSEALGQLYELYFDRIYRYCLGRLFNKDATEDVTSTVFLKVATSIHRFKGNCERQFKAWIYRIATREINNYIRSDSRHGKLLQAAATASNMKNSSGDEHIQTDLTNFYEAIFALKPRYQAAIILRFFEGMRTDEIAEILATKPVTVRVILSRALSSLRTKLANTSTSESSK